MMTYVMCMYQVFPHDDDVIAESNYSGNNNNFASTSPASGGAVHQAVSGVLDSGAKKSSPSSGSSSVTASPLKVPPKVVTKGKTSFSCCHLSFAPLIPNLTFSNR